MAPLTIEFQVSGDARLASDVIKERLELLPLVATADLEIQENRQGFADGVSILFGTVVLLKLGTVAVAQFRLLLRELAGLQQDLSGTQSILVHIDGQKLDPSEVDDGTLEKLVAALRAAN